MWTLLIASALAGYGDAVDGHPNRIEREVHLWTNGVRISPSAFSADFGGPDRNCFAGFGADQTAPRAPLAFHDGLADIAWQHSVDMVETDATDEGGGGSAMSHASSDGTTFAERVSPYYPSPVLGENVAWGFKDAYSLVMTWMCSAGHRENILRGTFVEMGVGQSDTYWTQDFGGRDLDMRVLNMGTHLDGSGTVTLAVDAWQPTEPVVAVLDGVATDMALESGEDGSGVYTVELPVDEGCHLYWFASGEARFPQDGAYGFGACAFDDGAAQWSAGSTVVAALPQADMNGDGVPDVGGCDQGGTGASWLGLIGALALGRRRR